MKKEIYTDVIPEGVKVHCPDMVLIGVGKESDECMEKECSISN